MRRRAAKACDPARAGSLIPRMRCAGSPGVGCVRHRWKSACASHGATCTGWRGSPGKGDDSTVLASRALGACRRCDGRRRHRFASPAARVQRRAAPHIARNEGRREARVVAPRIVAMPAGRARKLRKQATKKPVESTGFFVFVVARPERFELPTAWFVARYSIQLSYGRAAKERDYSGFGPSRQHLFSTFVASAAGAAWAPPPDRLHATCPRDPPRSDPVIRPVPRHECGDAGLDGRGWRIAHVALQGADVGEGIGHIAGL